MEQQGVGCDGEGTGAALCVPQPELPAKTADFLLKLFKVIHTWPHMRQCFSALNDVCKKACRLRLPSSSQGLQTFLRIILDGATDTLSQMNIGCNKLQAADLICGNGRQELLFVMVADGCHHFFMIFNGLDHSGDVLRAFDADEENTVSHVVVHAHENRVRIPLQNIPVKFSILFHKSIGIRNVA